MSVTTNNQNFIQASFTPFVQDWESINPIHFVYLLDQTGELNPAFTTLKIKDITVIQATTYSQIRYAAKKTFINNNNSIDWLLVHSSRLGANISQTEISTPFAQSSATDTINYTIQNKNLLPVGNYQAKVTYQTQGLQNGNWITITSYDVFINFDIYDNEQITWENTPFVVNHVYGNTSFGSASFIMNGPDWKVFSNNNNLQLSCNDTSVVYGTDANGNWLSGTGTKTISVNATAYHNTAQALAQGLINNLLFVFAGDTNFIGFIEHQVNVLQTEFFANPSTINFNVVKGEAEPEGIIVDVFSLEPYTYTVPYWLTVTEISQSAPGIPNKLLVKPISYDNLSAGFYTDDIVLSGLSNGVATILNIDVNYTIEDLLTLPYSQEDYNFTKDPLLLNFHTDMADTYFEMKATITSTDFVFQSSEVKSFEIPFKIPLFNKKQQFNLGKIVEKAMFKFANPLQAISNLYNAASVTLEIKERMNNTNTFVRDFTIENIKFLSGLTPNFKVGNNGFLDVSNGIKRVTPKSIDYINMMLTIDNNKSVEIFKNNISINSFPLFSITQTHKLKLDFSTLLVNAGDVIDVKIWLDADKTISISKKYLVFPEQDYSTFIIWENEYRLPEIFDFTGKYFLNSEIENVQAKNFNEIIEKINLVDNLSNEKIKINTGHLTQNDISYIKSIIKQKRAWILLPNNKLIEVFPITKSILETDVDRELINYDIEFQINKIYDEENNSF